MAKGLSIAVRGEYRLFADDLEVGRPPLFVTLLALVYRYLEVSVRSSFWVPKAFGLVNVLLLYFIGEKLFGDWVGFVAVVLMLCSEYFTDYLFARVLLDSAQAAFLNLGMLYLALGFQREKTLHFVVAACSAANAFLTKESAVWWLAFPVVIFLIVNHYRSRKNLIGLGFFYSSFLLLVSWWWVYVYIVTGGIYLVDTAQYPALKRLVPFAPILFLLLLILLYGLRRRKSVLAFCGEHKAFFSISCSALGFLLLGFFLAVAVDPFPVADLRHYWTSRLFPVVQANKVFYLFVPSWIYIAYLLARRRPGIACLSIVYLIMNIPLFTILVKYYLRPQSMWAFLAFSCLPVGVVVTTLVRAMWRIASNLSGAYSWVVGATLVMLVLGGSVAVVSSSLSFENALGESSYPSLAGGYNLECASWVTTNVEADAGILLHSIHDGTLYFLMRGTEYRVHSLPTQRGSFRLTSAGTFLPDDHKIYVDAKDRSRSGAGPGVYEFLSDRALLQRIVEEEIDYIVYGSQEGKFGYPPSLDSYFEDQSAYEPVCQAGSVDRGRVSVYRVDRQKLSPAEMTYIDSAALSRSLVDGRSRSYSDYEVVRSIGSDIRLWVEDSDDVGHLELGDIYLRAGMLDQALAHYREFLETHPEEPLIVLEGEEISGVTSRAVSHTWMGQYDAALGTYGKVLAEDSQMVAGHVGRGDSYWALGHLEDAEDAYLAALSIDPWHPEANRKLGDLYREREEYERAIQRYAFAAQRTNAISVYWRLYMAWGDYLQLSGDLDEAIRYYRKAVQYPYVLDHSNLLERVTADILCSGPQLEDSLATRISAFYMDPRKLVLFQHPPSELSYRYRISESARLKFSLALSPEVWQLGKGDGGHFYIYVDNGEMNWLVFSQYIDPKNIAEDRGWHDREVDLSRWAGETVTVTLATDCGPRGNCDYDWAGWGAPRIVQPIAYSFLTGLPDASRSTTAEERIREDRFTIDYETRRVLSQHPPSRVTYRVGVPDQAGLRFGLGMDPAVWSPSRGDGVEYNVYVRRADDPYVLHRVFHRYIDPKNNRDDRHWQDVVVDLSDYGGERVDIIFETLAGPDGAASFDWAGWSNPVLIAEDMALARSDITE